MKKLRPEVENDLKGRGNIMESMDDVYCSAFNMTLDELDYIAEHATDDEIMILNDGLGGLNKKSTFTEKRQSLMIRNKFLTLKNADNQI